MTTKTTKTKCSTCGGSRHVFGAYLSHNLPVPCPDCTDSGTPLLDESLGIRYAAGIDKDGKLVRPINECLRKDGTVLARPYR